MRKGRSTKFTRDLSTPRSILPISVGGCIYGYNIGIVSFTTQEISISLHLSQYQSSLFTAIFLFGLGIAMPLAGWLVNIIGRRKQLIWGGWTALLATTLLTLCHQSFVAILFARALLGCACALLNIAIPLYLSESIPADWRGIGTATFQLWLSGGIVLAAGLAHELSPHSSWWWLYLPQIAPCIVTIFAAHSCHETPYFLITRGKARLALKQLLSTRNASNARQEYQQLQELTKTVGEYRRESTIRLLALTILICSLNQWIGINAFIQHAYYVTNFLEAHKGYVNIQPIFISAINFCATVLAIFLTEKIERKRLLQVGLLGAAVSLLIVCATGRTRLCEDTMSAVSLLGFGCFIFFFALGPGALVWTVTSEILPTHLRGPGMSVALTLSSLSGSAATFLFLPMAQRYGLDSIFAFSIVVSAIYVSLSCLLPNVNGRTLAAIEGDMRHS